MSDIENSIKRLSDNITELEHKQKDISIAVSLLAAELAELKLKVPLHQYIHKETITPGQVIEAPETFLGLKQEITAQKIRQFQKKNNYSQKLEDFIGTNLISKVGIVITLIGIFIGAKYAIDKNMIGAGMRIILSYLAGSSLVITAIFLKRKYENFSAVLMGGGLAVLYFVTYVAYGFYQFFSQLSCFLIMVGITAAAVFTALWYNKKIIAILGQVGAYAIPFLLSNGSGKVLILFSYISIINVGLLILSLRKDWKLLYRLAFFLTWLIYGSWLALKQPELLQERIGYIFLFIIFFTFYSTFLFYKVIKKEPYNLAEIGLLLLNALLFFFFGSFLIDGVFSSSHALTYFTMANAGIHFIIGYIIYTLKLFDKTVHQFITGLGILFITVTIPIELNGSWVTLLWSTEAAILCHIGFKNKRNPYLGITLPMVAIAVLSLLQDWFIHYPHLTLYNRPWSGNILPFWNITFLFSLFVSTCFGYISFLAFKSTIITDYLLKGFFRAFMPVVFFFMLFLSVFNEIHFAWDTVIKPAYNYTGADDARIYLRQLSLLIYTLLYVALFLKLNSLLLKSILAAKFLITISLLCAAIFLLQGLNILSETIRDSLKSKSNNLPFILFIRYVTFLSLAALVIACRAAINLLPGKPVVHKIFSLVFNVVLLSVICSEFAAWMTIGGYTGQNKLGITIICGIYALLLIISGIKARVKYLRIAAMVLFGFTLLKLFFYDLAKLSTVSKTLVLVILGVLLLVISFMYNKFKTVILGEVDDGDKKD